MAATTPHNGTTSVNDKENANNVAINADTGDQGSGPLNLVFNPNDPIFPIASFSLRRLGFTYGQVLHIQNLVAAQHWDPESAVWIQRFINHGTPVNVAKNVTRLTKAGWEVDRATQWLLQPANQGWNTSGRDVVPPPPQALQMLQGGWLLYDAVRWLIKHRGKLGDVIPVPPTAAAFVKMGWKVKDAVVSLTHFNGLIPNPVPVPPAVFEMIDAGWAIKDAVEYLVKQNGELGKEMPKPSTKASRAQERAQSLKRSKENTALGFLQHLIRSEAVDRILEFVREEAACETEQPPREPQISPGEYQQLVRVAYRDTEVRLQVWHNARSGGLYDPRNEGLVAEWQTLQQGVKTADQTVARDTNVSAAALLGMVLHQLVALTACMNKEIKKIQRMEKDGVAKARKGAEEAKRTAVRKSARESDAVITLAD